MRSYKINIERTVNRLTPHYLGGRKLILFIQSLLYPLSQIADKWETWATRIRMEAGMTSQIILFENFLTVRFSQYFSDPGDKVTIMEGVMPGVILYHQSAQKETKHLVLYNEIEKSGKDPALRWQEENPKEYQASFNINMPALKPGVSDQEIIAMVSFYADRYKIAGKKYTITFNKIEK